MELDGIPANVGDDPEQLKEAVLKVFNAINVEVEDYEIDTVHRLPSRTSPKPVIVRSVSRETVRALHRNKNKLRYLSDLRIDITGLNDNSRIFIRPSLSPYMNNLSYNCRQLKRAKLIQKLTTGDDGRLTVQKLDGSYLKVVHELDLTSNFPTFAGFSFDFDRRSLNANDNE